jgi:hypothetical protein
MCWMLWHLNASCELLLSITWSLAKTCFQLLEDCDGVHIRSINVLIRDFLHMFCTVCEKIAYSFQRLFA